MIKFKEGYIENIQMLVEDLISTTSIIEILTLERYNAAYKKQHSSYISLQRRKSLTLFYINIEPDWLSSLTRQMGLF